MNSPLPLEQKLSLYSDTVTRDTGQYFCNSRPFSMPRTGNKVSILSSGKVVLQNIYDALQKARHFIWIADWQMAFDVELVERGNEDHPGQLHKVLEQIIKNKPVQVRVLLFGSINDKVPGTYDGMVAEKLNGLNKKGYPGSIRVELQSPTSAQRDSFDYSHHQKFVVVDGVVGFIGGIDLSYGRWETPEFDIVVDPARFLINEMYSPGMTRLRPLSNKEKITIKKFDCAAPYGETLIEEGCQPRMPWQDVHIKIEGPSVVDIHRNFVRRWNIKQSRNATPFSKIEMINKQWLEKVGGWHGLVTQQAIKGGGAQVQIVRSVSNQHLRNEGSIPSDLLLYADGRERDTWEQCLGTWSGQHQDNILNAMVNCINGADNYVYIETQFFISSFGTWGTRTLPIDDEHNVVVPVVDSAQVGNENNGIKNTIVDALVGRIIKHIDAKTPFHVYMVVPVHPEGDLTNGAVWKQHWLALTTIKHGSNSLINRIRRALLEKKRNPEEWVQYLTVLNMRSHGATVQYARNPTTFDEDFSHEIGRFVVTEQIYIHSKLLIVDDAVAIVGSANINDRSLTGNGDTEIAAVVVDTEGVELRDLGSPTLTVQTRKFARELRRQLWEKHFGFMIKSTNEEDTAYFNSTFRAGQTPGKAASRLEHPPRLKTSAKKVSNVSGVEWEKILDQPCAPDVVKAVQTIAAHNARIYEEVFQHTPRNSLRTFAACTSFPTLPYAALYDATGTSNMRAATMANAYRQPLFKPMTETQKVDELKRGKKNFQAFKDAAGKNARYKGVIPVALQARFMTTQLLPHQKAALNESTYGRLQQLYAGDKVHDVNNAIVYLKENVVGFFVAMPLDWGMGTAIKDDPTQHGTVDIAKNDSLSHAIQGSQT
jgi:phospholipase D1/2